ncbi:hypothetical protein HF086_000275 [Spodoptera exigua]|uniref:Rho-GAP domain-containing protein n=1 Tax=Spodoptera exigua TaxID=7107 RepID=A0A922SC74_SPOEX|nr:hypothetical protein HF086_000275 [Spodoptera exigua]
MRPVTRSSRHAAPGVTRRAGRDAQCVRRGVRHDDVEQAVLHVRARRAPPRAHALQPDERQDVGRHGRAGRERRARLRRARGAPLLLGGAAGRARRRAHAAGAGRARPRRLAARAGRRARARAARPPPAPDPALALDDAGFAFVRRVLAALEARGLEEQGLYRVAGVASKVARLVAAAAAGRVPPLDDPLAWETKTLTSALKSYLRALPDPLLTRALHDQFIAVASEYTTCFYSRP